MGRGVLVFHGILQNPSGTFSVIGIVACKLEGLALLRADVEWQLGRCQTSNEVAPCNIQISSRCLVKYIYSLYLILYSTTMAAFCVRGGGS